LLFFKVRPASQPATTGVTLRQKQIGDPVQTHNDTDWRPCVDTHWHRLETLCRHTPTQTGDPV